MPDHAFTPTLGLLDRWSFDSPLLANRLGDPTEREVLVHIPPEGVEDKKTGWKIIDEKKFTNPVKKNWFKTFIENIY